MKKVKKMAIGGMGTSPMVKSAPQAFQSAGMNVNLPTGQRGFSSAPTMGGVGNQPKPSTPIMTGPLGSMGTPPAAPPTGLNVAGIRQATAGLGDTFKGTTNPPTSLANVGSVMQRFGMPGAGRAMKKNGAVKMKSGGKTSSASKRADGCVTKGKTRGRMV